LTTVAGAWLVGRATDRLVDLIVRDAASAELLRPLGVEEPVLAADLAFALPPPTTSPIDTMVVILRPWTGRRHRVPVAIRRPEPLDPMWLDRIARGIDAAAARTGLGVTFVVLDRDKDRAISDAVAGRLHATATVVEPAALDVPAAVAAGRVVVSMRYHGGVAACLAGRPSVLLGYDPKVGGLADDLDARVLDWQVPEPDDLAAAVVDALARPADLLASDLDRLRHREGRNRTVLESLLSAT
jgi:polysaccharide pyruvyl transferase WcaK-like protein